MELEQLYRSTVDVWGEQAQYDQAVEECAELIAALMHYRREKVDAQQVIDELADVTLMLGQLTWMFGKERVEEAVQRKRIKLDDLMERENAQGAKKL
ncbi:MAG: antitoxin [Desulfobacteraceae bacterium 4572_35.2]|nr:MAG: antitoxin [Desulfobacteraceae bacterium 4572_35.2]